MMTDELNELESARNQLVDKIASSPATDVDNLMLLLDAVDDFRAAFDVDNDDINNN